METCQALVKQRLTTHYFYRYAGPELAYERVSQQLVTSSFQSLDLCNLLPRNLHFFECRRSFLFLIAVAVQSTRQLLIATAMMVISTEARRPARHAAGKDVAVCFFVVVNFVA